MAFIFLVNLTCIIFEIYIRLIVITRDLVASLQEHWCNEFLINLHDGFAVFFGEGHRADVHDAWMYLGLTMVRVEDDSQITCFIRKHRTMTDSHQIAGFLKDGITRIFGPWPRDLVCGGKSDSIKRALIAIGRIGHKVLPFMLQYERTFV